MGTPLSMMHNEIRKRVGLKVNTSNSEDRILDEQGTAKMWPALEIPGSHLIRVLQNRMKLSMTSDTRR